MAELVRERHQDHSAQTRLHVFFGRVFGQAGENFRELRLERAKAFAIGICRHLMPRFRASASASSMLPRDEIRARHGNADDVFRAERIDGDRSDDGGIDPAAQARARRI